MYISELYLKDFRNHADTRVSFSPGVNVIAGENAQGKTNLLESIAYLSLGRSFRTAHDDELIREGCERAYVRARVSDDGLPREIEAMIGERKSVKIDGMPIKKLSELFGSLLTVAFTPDDIAIVRDSPPVRRRFMDTEICKMRVAYYYDLTSYLSVLRQKNALLRQGRSQGEIRELVSTYNKQLSDYAADIVRRRRMFIDSLSALLPGTYRAISGGRDEISVKYRQCAEGEVADFLFKKYENAFFSEYEQRTTLYGPHREDISFFIDGRDARIYASQGQKRTLTVALKLCCAAVMEKYTKRKPVVLLDDIFSELDARRQRGLISAVSGCQLVITTADRGIEALKSVERREFTLSGGVVRTCP